MLKYAMVDKVAGNCNVGLRCCVMHWCLRMVGNGMVGNDAGKILVSKDDEKWNDG